ncbi:helix-turn-helix transcriptional regulator [Herbaspirillum sp.]|mgnify:CR=1 FL=1|jgi:DNA-binding XRE family transcriptional regulator|uniref:helix-turn-helix domain-containing protein n=1 Tax=Herbaspirillum sp. TaxID=1890675 RepID=UPI00257A598E|nr:helix-turn-helix transcriptional regulator [Herbaspirillum sp.]
MSPTILYQTASSAPSAVWKTSTDGISGSISHAYAATRFLDGAQIIEALEAEHTDFDAFMAELEADPANAEHFQKADNWIAETFYGGDAESMRRLRERKGISQSVLAGMVGTSQPQIARIESGKSDPQLSTILKLTKALDVDANAVCAALGGIIVDKIWSAK